MLVDLLSESYAVDLEESLENDWTATPVRVFAVRLHQIGCSLRETTTILAELGVERSHGAVWIGHIGWLPAAATRLRRSPRGSRLMRPLSRVTASGLGCTLH
jgi:hypothetical protein